MSCRTSSSGSALTTTARLSSGLSDVQVLSLYHALRADAPDTAEAPTPGQWRNHLRRQRAAVEAEPSYTPARRASLLARLARAENETPPDAATYYAQRNIARRAAGVRDALAQEHTILAQRLGISTEEVAERARQIADQALAPGSGVRRNPAGRTDTKRQFLRRCGLPQDRGTAAALLQLRAEAAAADAARLEAARANAPARITRVQSAMSHRPWSEHGYDPADGRMELVDRQTGEILVYRNIPQSVYQNCQYSRPYFERNVRGIPAYQYDSAAQADADSRASRCAACGQWSDSRHTCPPGTVSAAPRRVPYSTGRHDYQRETASYIQMPGVTEIRAAARTGPVIVPTVATFHDGSNGSAQAEIVVTRINPREFTVEATNPRCTCEAFLDNGTCPHVDGITRAVLNRVTPPSATARPSAVPLTDEQIAQARARAQTAMEQDWTRSEQHAAASRTRFAAAKDGTAYADDFDSFKADYDAARARAEAGDRAVPFLTGEPGQVTAGLGARGTGRAFGVELEFDFKPGTDRAVALAQIGRELHEAGLTPTASQTGYHSSARRGYTDNHQGGWSFENDCTVSGEIVSPIMYDEPDTWANIQKVCDILERNGARATARTGSHVHVSAGEYDHNPANHTELVRTVNAYEDVLYRISQNPAANKHRPTRWCGPNTDAPPEGYASVDTTYDGGRGLRRYVTGARDSHNSHRLGLNLQSMRGMTTDHVEMRHWDGSLDPGVIQTQIKTSLAIVDAAQRNAGKDGALPREPLGSHASRRDPNAPAPRRRRGLLQRPDDTELAEESTTFRHLADTLFSRREDKAQVAALFAMTGWNSR